MRKFIFMVPYLFMVQYVFANEPLPGPPVNIESFCKTYSGQSSFIKELGNKILSHNESRSELVSMMRHKKAQGCSAALTDYLSKATEGDGVSEQYLLLAFAANLPVATQIIEKGIAEGKFLDWLDIFQQSDNKAYIQSLSQWVGKVAGLLRRLDHAELVDERFYGKVTGDEKDIKTPESIPIWNPMLINKYMAEIKNQKIRLTKNDFSDLNIIYAASNQSYREVFLTQMSSVISLSETNWITSFRVEPSWVQFRLFPVMGKVGGGLIKRELIWLSQYHQNFKMRSLAETTLDKVNARSTL